jgi:DNA-binding NarL/FixJ family response regulator
MIRILTADNYDVVRSRRVLEAEPGREVVAEAGDGKEAISKVYATKPDVAVLDSMMPLVSGVEVTTQIRSRLRKTEVLIFTIQEDEWHIAETLDAGARGYVLKSDNTEQLLDAIVSLADHKPFFTTIVSETLLRSFLTQRRRDGMCLSDWERNMVQLIAEGHTNRQVAKLLKVGHKTLESRRMAIMRRLQLASAAATQFATGSLRLDGIEEL